MLASGSTCHTSAHLFLGRLNQDVERRYRLNRRPAQMEHFLETWGYLAVFVLSFISAMGLPVGAELAVIYGGVLASGEIAHEPHHLNLVLVIVLATVGEVAGSLAGYLI